MSNKRYLLPVNLRDAGAGHFQELLPELQFLYTPMPHDEQDTPLDARLLYVSTAKYERDWHSSTHAHTFSELFYVTGGKGHFMARGKKFSIEKNHLVIINPQVDHTEFSSEDEPLEYIVLGIEGLQFAPSDERAEDAGIIHFTQTQNKTALYLEALREEVQNTRIGYEAVCQNLLNIILILILRHEEIKLSITASNNISMACAEVKDYIDTHFKEPLSLEILAEHAHQNKFYIAHTFKNAYGMSPIKYLMNRRVQESKYLLDETDVAIGQIASITGFSSASHFCQAFRRITGTTAIEYRKKTRSQQDPSRS